MDQSVVKRTHPDGVVPAFSYDEAFCRNLGWLTEREQQSLRGKCVAIAGMGGVGGGYLLTLTRLGVGAFRIADLDRFELVNFNRQVGATLDSLGRPKVEVMAEKAWQINPELRISSFGQGVNERNLDEFLAGADVCIDGLDFFVIDIRRKLMARCAELGIPVVLAAPLGMGAAYLCSSPAAWALKIGFGLRACPRSINTSISCSAWRRQGCIEPIWWIRAAWICAAGAVLRPERPASCAPAWPRSRRSSFCSAAAECVPSLVTITLTPTAAAGSSRSCVPVTATRFNV